ncbi:MAG: IS30 family transposase [Actinomycetota bacterium]
MPGSRLSLDEREEIAVGVAAGQLLGVIARRIGRCVSTVSRELVRNSNRDGEYRALGADRKARDRARRPKRRVLDDARLCRRVTRLLGEKHSPMTVSRLIGGGVSHETIYQEIYRRRFGDPRVVLCRPRRSRRRRTRTGRYPETLGEYRSITTRDPDVSSQPGHWEGDLLVGHDNRTAAVVITERHSRICLLGALPQGRNADHVAQVVTRLLETVPASMRRTLTWDQGRELTRWPRIETALGIPIYFCQPRSPWQKPLVENQNGLLRRWLAHNQPIPRSQATLNHIAHRLNKTPRRILGWQTATDTYHQLVAATTT